MMAATIVLALGCMLEYSSNIDYVVFLITLLDAIGKGITALGFED